MYGVELAETGLSKFRARHKEVNIAMLYINFVIERHREALLWAFIVAKSDRNLDGVISAEEMDDLIQACAPSLLDSNTTVHSVQRPYRPDQLAVDLASVNIDAPKETIYRALSANGYAYTGLEEASKDQQWPDYTEHITAATEFCAIQRDCFALDRDASASDLFKHVTFEKQSCGDCIIASLLGQSSSGFDAVLPAASKASATELQSSIGNSDWVQVLPTGKRWQDIDFSRKSIADLAHEDARDFCMRLIQRYSYVLVSRLSVSESLLFTPRRARHL